MIFCALHNARRAGLAGPFGDGLASQPGKPLTGLQRCWTRAALPPYTTRTTRKGFAMPGDFLGTRCIARFVLLSLTLVVSAAGFSRVAVAQIGSDRYSSIVIEASTGAVLSAVNPDEPRYPASLTKLMTLYMVFEALREGRIGLEQPVPVSAYAAAMQPSKLGLLPGMELTVGQAILGLVTKSANDAAAALGELHGGDEVRFAEMMTLRATILQNSELSHAEVSTAWRSDHFLPSSGSNACRQPG